MKRGVMKVSLKAFASHVGHIEEGLFGYFCVLRTVKKKWKTPGYSQT